MPDSRQFTVLQTPTHKLTAGHFRLETAPRPEPGPGQALIRLQIISLDPANRAWMQGATYRDAVDAGQVMAGYGLGEVVESNAAELQPGDLVAGDLGWREYAVASPREVERVQRREPLTHLVSVFGITGLTAYIGLTRCASIRPGDTVVVSAAAGAVGSLAGQIARLKGARVVGIAGGRAKCDWLVQELGFHAALDYKAGEVRRGLRELAPDGVDIYFDNVGGDVFEACLFNMKPHGRIVCCGAVSQYDGAAPRHGPRGIPGLIVTKRLTLEGFIVYDFRADWDAALRQLETWIASGELKAPEDVLDGFERLPDALVGLLNGENRGKRMVRLS